MHGGRCVFGIWQFIAVSVLRLVCILIFDQALEWLWYLEALGLLDVRVLEWLWCLKTLRLRDVRVLEWLWCLEALGLLDIRVLEWLWCLEALERLKTRILVGSCPIHFLVVLAIEIFA